MRYNLFELGSNYTDHSMKTVNAFIGFLLFAETSYAQIRVPQTPQFPSVQPVYGSAPTTNYSATTYQQPSQVKMGANSQDVINRQNHQVPNTPIDQKRQEIEQIAKDMQANPKRFDLVERNRANASTEHFKRFDDALKHLNDMLSGKACLSVADAYYTIEDAFGNNYLTREEYNHTVKQSIDFIKAWMLENKLDIRDNYQVQYAIQRFMSETLTLYKVSTNGENGTNITPIEHKPFHYDYNDYQGEKDYRNLFVTKCFATGFGQCASMPGVYLILAEGLGVKAYLTFAPQHSFIKYLDNSGNIVNYEPTSNWEISDKWYKDNMFISAKAIENRLYLDTLNSKQVVANCLFDLAVNYAIIDRTGKEDFILECLRSGMPYFPKNNNLQPLFIKSMHLKTMLREIMWKKGITRLEDIEKEPEARKLYNEYIKNEGLITKLGYQDMPAGMYEEMLNQHEFKGKIQKGHSISGKEKRELFSQN